MIGDELYRYAVRCNRAKFEAIEKAAKRAGLTANQFVQAHFQTILDDRQAAPAEEKTVDVSVYRDVEGDPAFKPKFGSDGDAAIARLHRLSINQYRVWLIMKSRMDDKSVFADRVEVISGPLHLSPETVRVMMTHLRTRNMITPVYRGKIRQFGLWRVNPLPALSPEDAP